MNLFWDEDVPFIAILGKNHYLYILMMLLFFFLLVSQYKRIQKNPLVIHKYFLVFSVSQQILLYSWYFFETGFDLQEALPLHLSRITSLLGIMYLLTKKKKWIDLSFYFGLFAYGTFLYPQRVYPVYHILGISFFINHAITILLPIFAAIAYHWRPSFIGVFSAYKWFLIYFLSVYLLNPLINGNYFYLKYRPFFRQWPDYKYIPFILVGTLIAFLLGYLGTMFVIKTIEFVKSKEIKEINY